MLKRFPLRNTFLNKCSIAKAEMSTDEGEREWKRKSFGPLQEDQALEGNFLFLLLDTLRMDGGSSTGCPCTRCRTRRHAADTTCLWACRRSTLGLWCHWRRFSESYKRKRALEKMTSRFFFLAAPKMPLMGVSTNRSFPLLFFVCNVQSENSVSLGKNRPQMMHEHNNNNAQQLPFTILRMHFAAGCCRFLHPSFN